MVRYAEWVDADTRIGFFNTMVDAKTAPGMMALRSKEGPINCCKHCEHLPYTEGR
jgi:hypothetical protein